MKNITFEERSAQKVYESYIKRIARTTSGLLPEDREDIMMEFNSHIFESLQRNSDVGEMENLLTAIDSLGEPEEVLQPLIADKTLSKATRTFNPITVFKAIALNIRNGFEYSIFALFYLFLLGFLFMAGAKIFNPNEVGLYFKHGQFHVLGKTSEMGAPYMTEVLGSMFIPVMLSGALLFYLMTTLALRVKRKKSKRLELN